MKIILKFVLRNIREKKLRTLLIIFSVIISTMLFLATSGISNAVEKQQINDAKEYYGNAEIMIGQSENAPSPYFNDGKANDFKDKYDYMVEEINSSATYENTKGDYIVFSLIGVDYKDLMRMNPLQLKESSNVEEFEGDKIVISEETANKYKLKIGDSLKLVLRQGEYKFTISGISKSQGIFRNEEQSVIGIVPKQLLAKICDVKQGVSTIYIKTKNKNDKDYLIDELSKYYSDYGVKQTVDINQIKQNLQSIMTAFLVMFIVVVGISAFIIYTAFKVITIERISIIGTFRSVGATRLIINIVLLLESIIYGTLGGIIGILGGTEVSKLVLKLFASAGSSEISISYSVSNILEAFLFALVVSVLSSLMPIIKISRISIKEIILNSFESDKVRRISSMFLGAVLIIAPILLLKVVGDSLKVAVGLVGIIFEILGIVILVPFLLKIICIITEKLVGIISNNMGLISIKNIRSNKKVTNNISLLVIGISAFFMIDVVSYSLNKEVVKAYQLFKYDVILYPRSLQFTDEIISKVSKENGVKKVMGTYTAYNIGIDKTKNSISEIIGYNSKYFNDFFNIKFLQDEKKVLHDLGDGRKLITSESFRRSINAKVGDYITLKTFIGNEQYQIVGTFDTLVNNGSLAIIPDEYMKSDFEQSGYRHIHVISNIDSDILSKKLSADLKEYQINSATWTYNQNQNIKQVNQLLSLIKVFPIASLIIGTFGIMNNFLISFIERKRELTIFASIGMSRNQTKGMLIIESFLISVVGIIIGILGGIVFSYILPFILTGVGLPLEMHYQSTTFLKCVIIGLFITFISSVWTVFKSSKLNILEVLKYE